MNLLSGYRTLSTRLGAFFPGWPPFNKLSQCFFTQPPTGGGPGGFAVKLRRQFIPRGVGVTNYKLVTSRAALIFKQSWGDWFFKRCKRWNVRTVYRVNGFYIPIYFDNRPASPMCQDRTLDPAKMKINYRMQRDLRLADMVIYQSVFCKEMLDQYLYKRRGNYKIIFNGVDLDQFHPHERQAGPLTLLSAGTLRHEYMLGTVLPVYERLRKRYDLQLRIVGPLDEINRRLLDEFSRKHPESAERIKWTGRVPFDEMMNHISQADLFVHPRLGDICPNIVIESLASGIPVVGGSWGGVRELVGKGGIVVDTDPWGYGEEYIEKLSEASSRVLDHLDTYKQGARSRAVEAFDIRNVALRYLDALGFDNIIT